MSWLFYAVFSVVLISIARLVDKFVDGDLRNPNVLSGFYGTGTGLVLVTAALMQGTSFNVEPSLIAISVIIAVIIMKAKYFYYKALEFEEVTRFIPILALSPLIVLVISLLLDAKLTQNEVLGVVLIFLGAFLVSFKSIKHHLELSHVAILGVLVSILFAVKVIVLKNAFNENTFWPILLYYGATCVLIGAFLVFTSGHKVKSKKHKREFTLAACNSVLMGFAMLLFNLALLNGNAAVVTAIGSTESVIVVILVLLAHKTKILELNENYTSSAIVQKFAAAIIAAIGTILLI